MPTERRRDPGQRAPEVVAPTNRINVALPFSKIQTQDLSEELRELATLVAELADVAVRLDPDATSEQLHERALRLVARLT